MVYRSDGGGSPEKPQNAFRNDGSFLEMFKKLQEEKAAASEGKQDLEKVAEPKTGKKGEDSSGPSTSTSVGRGTLPMVGKRRGGRVLPTGKVKKPKSDEAAAQESDPKDAWALYLAEVKRYKETTCEEDGKTRPLVK